MVIQLITLSDEIILCSSFRKNSEEYDCEFKEETKDNITKMVAYSKYEYQIANEFGEILFKTKNKILRDAVLRSIVDSVLFEFSTNNETCIIDLRNIVAEYEEKEKKENEKTKII